LSAPPPPRTSPRSARLAPRRSVRNPCGAVAQAATARRRAVGVARTYAARWRSFWRSTGRSRAPAPWRMLLWQGGAHPSCCAQGGSGAREEAGRLGVARGVCATGTNPPVSAPRHANPPAAPRHRATPTPPRPRHRATLGGGGRVSSAPPAAPGAGARSRAERRAALPRQHHLRMSEGVRVSITVPPPRARPHPNPEPESELELTPLTKTLGHAPRRAGARPRRGAERAA